MQSKSYTAKEEIANTLSHGIGALLSVLGLIIYLNLAVKYGNTVDTVSLSIFGISLILLYSISTIYHGVKKQSTKQFFQQLDHTAIFLLIAGTYTPLILLSLNGLLCWTILITIWLLAIIGIISEIFHFFKSRLWSVVLYVVMGWLAIIVIKKIAENIPLESLILLIIGGLFYTVGIIFYIRKNKIYSHAVWHIFVLLGSLSHYFTILTIFLSESS
ncbi:MAG: hemolysin III family protein [bacterium]|nr:hemolysin III family protein [bacterium]